MGECKFYSVRSAPFVIDGLLPPKDGEPFARIPRDVAVATSSGILSRTLRTSGGRIRFSTDATQITVKLLSNDPMAPKKMHHMPLLGSCGLDLYYIDGGRERRIGTFRYKNLYDQLWETGTTITLASAKMRSYVLYLPTYGRVDDMQIGIPEEATLAEPIDQYKIKSPIVFYGSSVTQGCSASRPALAYPAIISRMLGAQFINLGFAASAKGEPSMSEYIANIPDMSAFVLDYDQNAPSEEHLAETHTPFYRAVRAKHPNIPIVFVSAASGEVASKDSIRRRNVIMRSYLNAYDAGDENVYFVDGLTMMSDDNYSDRTADKTHPNDLGFERMAYAIGTVLRESLGKKIREREAEESKNV